MGTKGGGGVSYERYSNLLIDYEPYDTSDPDHHESIKTAKVAATYPLDNTRDQAVPRCPFSPFPFLCLLFASVINHRVLDRR